MQLTSINRIAKRDVTDKKFAICFKTKIAFGANVIPFVLVSLPIVIIVHVNQETNGLATIIWDSLFAEPNRIPFQVPDIVDFNRFQSAISEIFKYEVGRELSADNLHFIAEKLYDRDLPFFFVDTANVQKVSWYDFTKKKIYGRDFSLWEWIYNILKVIKEHLRLYWLEGAIEGLISKTNIERKLIDCPKGTFILRFSDSVKGSISIAYVVKNSSGKSAVVHVLPSTSKDLCSRSLNDRLNSFEELTHLFPNVKKCEAFRSAGDNNETFRETTRGYIVPIQKSRLPTFYDVKISS